MVVVCLNLSEHGAAARRYIENWLTVKGKDRHCDHNTEESSEHNKEEYRDLSLAPVEREYPKDPHIAQ